MRYIGISIHIYSLCAHHEGSGGGGGEGARGQVWNEGVAYTCTSRFFIYYKSYIFTYISDDIRKAYKKLALQYHPDKVE